MKATLVLFVMQEILIEVRWNLNLVQKILNRKYLFLSIFDHVLGQMSLGSFPVGWWWWVGEKS